MPTPELIGPGWLPGVCPTITLAGWTEQFNAPAIGLTTHPTNWWKAAPSMVFSVFLSHVGVVTRVQVLLTQSGELAGTWQWVVLFYQNTFHHLLTPLIV